MICKISYVQQLKILGQNSMAFIYPAVCISVVFSSYLFYCLHWPNYETLLIMTKKQSSNWLNICQLLISTLPGFPSKNVQFHSIYSPWRQICQNQFVLQISIIKKSSFYKHEIADSYSRL